MLSEFADRGIDCSDKWRRTFLGPSLREKILVSIGSNIFLRKDIKFSRLNRKKILDPILTNIFLYMGFHIVFSV